MGDVSCTHNLTTAEMSVGQKFTSRYFFPDTTFDEFAEYTNPYYLQTTETEVAVGRTNFFQDYDVHGGSQISLDTNVLEQ